MNQKYAKIGDKGIEILKSFNEVLAVGMAGSQTLGIDDEYSDIDIQAFTKNKFPEKDSRKNLYDTVDGVNYRTLDYDVSAEFVKTPQTPIFVLDKLIIDSVECDFLWLSEQGIKDIFSKLAEDENYPEGMGATVREIRPIYDPNGFIKQVMRQCPEYTMERAKRKARNNFGYAHWFICDWLVFNKAIRRKDIIAYQAAETEMVNILVTVLYAVNRIWQHDRRRLRFSSRGFEILPVGFLDRLELMIMRNCATGSLKDCLCELKTLFCDLAIAANKQYPEWNLPIQWD